MRKNYSLLMVFHRYKSNSPNNAINSVGVKRREKHAPLYTAGYGER
jgi:hypothetical protein